MKFFIVILSLAVAAHGQQAPQLPQLPGMDLPGAIISQVSVLTRQVDGIQSVLAELNGQLSRMIATGTRMVTGLQAEGAPNPMAAMITPITSIAEQMAQVQKALTDISNQFSRMVMTGSRLITGNPSRYSDEDRTNYAESFLRTMTDISRQLASTANVLRDINNSWNRMVESSSRLLAGLEGESANSTNPLQQVTGPAEAFIKGIGSATEQLNQVQRVANEMTNELQKMVSSSTRVLTGANRDGAGNPTDAAINTLTSFTRQFSEIQNVLRSLNEQFNRIVSSSTRVIGGSPRVARQAGAGSPTDAIMSSLNSVTQQLAQAQRVLSEMNASISRMVTSGSRLLG